MDEVGASRDKVVAHGDGGEKGMPGVVTRAGLASVGRAFLVGGAISVVVQLMMEALAPLMSDGIPTATRGVVALVLVSTLCVPLCASGVYGRIADFGGMGANLPFVGIVHAVSSTMRDAIARGVSPVKAAAMGARGVIVFFLTGFAFCLVFAALCCALGFGIYE